MKTGDLEPDWTVDIADSSQQADFGTVSSWRFVAWRETKTGPVVAFTDSAPAFTPGATAWTASVAHVWVDGETDTEGPLHAVVVAVWPGGREQSFPGEGAASLILESDPAV